MLPVNIPRRTKAERRMQLARLGLVQSCKALALYFFDSVILWSASIIGRRNRDSHADVLLIRLDAIGDAVLWLSGARALLAHNRTSGLQTTLIANEAWADWARELEMADVVWALDPRRFCRDCHYRARWLWRVRRAGFRHVIHPVHSRVLSTGDALVRASGAENRIGSSGDTTNEISWLKSLADRWYTKLIPCGGTERMELMRNAAFMRGLGFENFRAHRPALDATTGALPSIDRKGAYAVLAPGASWSGRQWPVAFFAEIGRRLINSGLSLAVVGSPADKASANRLMQQLGREAEDWVGRTSLGQLARLMQEARLVIANDSAPAHIAAAAGVPVVCIVGGGHYGRFMPYRVETNEPGIHSPLVAATPMECFGCNWHCIFRISQGEAAPCVSNVTVEQVWDLVKRASEHGFRSFGNSSNE